MYLLEGLEWLGIAWMGMYYGILAWMQIRRSMEISLVPEERQFSVCINLQNHFISYALHYAVRVQ